MPPRPPLSALRLRRYATVAGDAVAAASTSTSTLAGASAAAAAATPVARVFPERKAFLYSYYSHLLRRSSLVLLFQHANLGVADSNALRNAIAKIPVPAPAAPAAVEGEEAAPVPEVEGATLTIARTGLLAPVVRSVQTPEASLAEHLNGPTALVTCPSLSPRYLQGVLGAVAKTLKAAKRDEPKDKGATVKQPTFTLVAGVLEGNRLLTAEQIADVAKLPELDTLRAQLVGLLESPGSQLVGILGQAGGGSLVRTLQGLEQTLKDQSQEQAPPS